MQNDLNRKVREYQNEVESMNGKVQGLSKNLESLMNKL